MRLLKTISILSFFIVSTACLGQNQPIVYNESGFGTIFTQDGKTLRPKNLVTITEGQEEANLYMDKAKLNSDLATFFGFVGGALIGWPIGTALGGGDPNWALAGAGAGCIVIAIPLSSGYKKNAIKGVESYNKNISTSSQRRGTYQLTASGAGIGISFSF
jgi:hypothetical protein